MCLAAVQMFTLNINRLMLIHYSHLNIQWMGWNISADKTAPQQLLIISSERSRIAPQKEKETTL
jgi:hypothetical protein